MKKLQEPREEIYRYITEYTKNHAYPPSVREICEAVGLTSTATVHTHLKKLEQQGRITRDPTRQRSIRVTESAAGSANRNARAYNAIPLVGHVAAGVPILANENIEDSFPLPDILLHGSTREEVFMLRVEGESMHDAGIRDGDIIVVHSGYGFDNGDIVVARVEGESATVKRLYREKTCVRLQPENELFEPIYVPYDELEIVGKVIGLLRSF